MTDQPRRPRLSRLVAEGLVILVSILLAFSIDAWWDLQQDREREAAYLDQLVVDLERTLENNRRFSDLAARSDTAAARLVQSYYEAESPSRDSLTYWLDAIEFFVTQPELGTVEMLVTTGDLRLIRDDSVRARIPTYLRFMLTFDAFEADGEDIFNEASDELDRFVDRNQLRMEIMSEQERAAALERNRLAPLSTGPLRKLPSQNLQAIVRQPEVREILSRLLGAKSFMKAYRERMRSTTEEFLEQVHAAQAR